MQDEHTVCSFSLVTVCVCVCDCGSVQWKTVHAVLFIFNVF